MTLNGAGGIGGMLIQLFTALFVFSHFISGLPTPSDVEKLPKEKIIQMYSHACLDFYKRPEFQGSDLSQLVHGILQSALSKGKGMGWMEGKGRAEDVIHFYEKVCKPNPDLTALDLWQKEISQAVAEYKIIIDSLPEIEDLHTIILPQATEILSSDDKVVSDLYIREGRRKSIKIDQLPSYVPKIFVALEDNRFFDHKGVDEIGIIRALMKDVTSSGSRQGASTISQQLARNVYLSPVPTMRRKMQEILISEKIEKQLSKKEILELYLNVIYFGRNSWGIEKAAQTYFGKSAKNLTPLETAFLAGIVHGPNLYRNRPERIEKRVQFVIGRMKDNSISPVPSETNIIAQLKILPEIDIYNAGYFRDYTTEQIRKINPTWLTSGNQIKTSLDSRLQIIANEALQDGLINYEKGLGQRQWEGPLDNIEEEIIQNTEKLSRLQEQNKMETEKKKESLFSALVTKPKQEQEAIVIEKPWITPLNARATGFPVPVSRWKLAVALEENGKIGISEGAEGMLTPQSLKWMESIEVGDVFFVRPVGRNLWEAMQTPKVNGAVLVMTTTGRVLAMVGGFNYLQSSWNRATQALRQPGSLMKPFTYLAALQKKIQPNILLKDESLTFPPAVPGGRPWKPINYGKEINGPPRPMRWALENSRNVMTAQLMSQIGLDPIRELSQQFGLYENPSREYPFILGAQENNLLTMVKAYGEIANGGYLITPFVVDRAIETNGTVSFIRPQAPSRILTADDISLFQLRYLLQGVVERGTAARLAKYSRFIAGKTGTSNDSKDVWFIGFTSNIVVGVYIGYDNPEAMNGRATGGAIALPIFEKILISGIQNLYFPEPFPPPPKGIVFLPTNKFTGEIVKEMSADTVLEAYREESINKELQQ